MKKNKMLGPLPRRIRREMRKILNQLKSGALLHEQSDYHYVTDCGTAHCYAGWKAVLDFERETGTVWDNEVKDDTEICPTPLSYDLWVRDQWVSNTSPTYMGWEWQYAMWKWKLTGPESQELFGGSATVGHMEVVLGNLDRGLRYISTDPYSEGIHDKLIDPKSYDLIEASSQGVII